MSVQLSLRPTRYDYLFGAALCLIFIVFFAAVKHGGTHAEKNAQIYVNGKLLQILDLRRDKKVAVGTAEIEIRAGKIRIAKSRCPRQICEHAGWIADPGQTIVCVPNRIIIEIAGTHAVTKYDAVTY